MVAVASGGGLRRLYEELGAYVVDGGSTMNPSTYELLAGIHDVHASEVLVLPNSPNVILSAERAAELSERPARWSRRPPRRRGSLPSSPSTPPRRPRTTRRRWGRRRRHCASAGWRRRATTPRAASAPATRWARRRRARGLGSPEETLAATIARVGEGADLLTCIAGAGAPLPLEAVERAAPDRVELEYHEGGQPAWWWLFAAE